MTRLLRRLAIVAVATPLAAQRPDPPAPGVGPARRVVPPHRTAHTMAYDPVRRRVVLFGGVSDSGTFFADVWELDSAGWTRRPAATAPSPRAYAAAAYDGTRRGVLVFSGGDFRGNRADTWLWSGRSWSALDSGGGPEARGNHAMAYDGARRRVVLFGGRMATAADDTWEWDGGSWLNVAPAGESPAARSGHAMTYDADRERVILFGGKSGNDQRLGDTWEWDGVRWVEPPTAGGPSPRVYHAMAYDAARRRTVLFGGWDALGYTGDTWEWDGADWSRAQTGPAPTPRIGHVMAYDPTRRRVVLFGGGDGADAILNDTWAWDGARWTLLARGTRPDTGRIRVAEAVFALRRNLGALISAQARHRERQGRYTDSLTALAAEYRRALHVRVTVTEATDSGWAAVAWHGGAAEVRCGLYVGKAAPPIKQASREGVVACGRASPAR